MRTHGKWSTYNTAGCRCDLCCSTARKLNTERRRVYRARMRAADLSATEQCVICREWFPTRTGLRVHESIRHGLQ